MIESAWYAVVPVWVYRDNRVTPAVLRTYIELGLLAQPNGRDRRTVVLDWRALGERIGKGRSTVLAHFRVLREVGAIVERPGYAYLPIDGPENLDPAADDESRKPGPDSPENLDPPPYTEGSTEKPPTPSGSAPAAVEPDPPSRDDIVELCDHLATRIESFSASGHRPPVTAKWRKDMRLLVDRGPLHDEHAQPLGAAKVHASIEAVFDQLAEPEGRGGFCWAAQIRSPHALRDHWHQLAEAFRRMQAERRTPAQRTLDQAAGGRDHRALSEALADLGVQPHGVIETEGREAHRALEA